MLTICDILNIHMHRNDLWFISPLSSFFVKVLGLIFKKLLKFLNHVQQYILPLALLFNLYTTKLWHPFTTVYRRAVLMWPGFLLQLLPLCLLPMFCRCFSGKLFFLTMVPLNTNSVVQRCANVLMLNILTTQQNKRFPPWLCKFKVCDF